MRSRNACASVHPKGAISAAATQHRGDRRRGAGGARTHRPGSLFGAIERGTQDVEDARPIFGSMADKHGWPREHETPALQFAIALLTESAARRKYQLAGGGAVAPLVDNVIADNDMFQRLAEQHDWPRGSAKTAVAFAAALLSEQATWLQRDADHAQAAAEYEAQEAALADANMEHESR